jgi:hypothetical protein
VFGWKPNHTPDGEVSSFINENFVPLEAHIKEHPAYFHRFDAVWTPTVLVMDSDGTERLRVEGYLPKEEFRSHLEMGWLVWDHARLTWPASTQYDSSYS